METDWTIPFLEAVGSSVGWLGMNVGIGVTIDPTKIQTVDGVLPMSIPVKTPQTWLTVLLHGHVILQGLGTEALHISELIGMRIICNLIPLSIDKLAYLYLWSLSKWIMRYIAHFLQCNLISFMFDLMKMFILPFSMCKKVIIVVFTSLLVNSKSMLTWSQALITFL